MPETNALRALPSIEKLVGSPSLRQWESQLTHAVRVRVAQELVASWRERVRQGETLPDLPQMENALANRFRELLASGMRKVINATGVLLHTNLGRAPLGTAVLEKMAREIDGYCTLEFDLKNGARGSRGAAVERLLEITCDTPAALVVNNCASAIFFVLHTLAVSREVILSRGELVQIGGGFRIPDILSASGATLREVGTTNITSASDYEAALSEKTALLLKVHQSCFVIEGHTSAPTLAELSAVAKAGKVPLVVDLGSGQLVDAGIDELSLSSVQHAGADLICFSGDKLLGGPQAGIVIGRADLIQRLKASPLYRALRLGKTELYLLEQTLLAYAAGKPTPTEERITESQAAIAARADRLIAAWATTFPGVRRREAESSIGGGTAPSHRLPSWVIEIESEGAERFARRLLAGSVPVVALRDQKRVGFDLRTVFPHEDETLRAAVLGAKE